MDLIYQKIVDTFNNNKQVFIDRNLPPVRQVDIYMGQPDDPASFELFLPAVFVDWSITEGTDKDENFMQLDFHVIQEPGIATENFSERLTEGLEYIQMIKTVKYLVNRSRAENTTPLSYIGERPRITPFFKYHIVSEEDSINRPTNTEVELTDYDLTGARAKQKKEPDPAPSIDTYQ